MCLVELGSFVSVGKAKSPTVIQHFVKQSTNEVTLDPITCTFSYYYLSWLSISYTKFFTWNRENRIMKKS